MHRTRTGEEERRMRRLDVNRKRRSTNYQIRSDLVAKPLRNMTRGQIIEFFNGFQMVIVVCEGVLWNENNDIIPNAGRALSALKSIGKSIRFVTSEVVIKEALFLGRFESAGVADVKRTDIVHPIKSMMRFLNYYRPGQTVFSICSADITEILRKMDNTRVLTMPPHIDYNPTKLKDRVFTDEKVDAVVMDLNFRLTYGEVAKAAHYLKANEMCVLVVASSKPLTKLTNSVESLGMGGFVNILRECSHREPVILDAPGPELREEIRRYFDINNAERVLFIGSSMINDIHFASSSGFQTLLLTAGASPQEEMLGVPENLKPAYIADSLADLEALIENMKYT